MQCTRYTGRDRCKADATRKLVAPDGEAVPGGGLCEDHARRTLTEYQEKLDPEWSWLRIDEYGRPMDEPGSFQDETAKADAAGMLGFWDYEDGADEDPKGWRAGPYVSRIGITADEAREDR